eukprot:2250800-Amphidinium_carterae.1
MKRLRCYKVYSEPQVKSEMQLLLRFDEGSGNASTFAEDLKRQLSEAEAKHARKQAREKASPKARSTCVVEDNSDGHC